MTKSCISCHVCLNNIFLATYKGMRCSSRLLHSSVLIMLASVGLHLNERNDLIKQMVAIPSHLTDKINSLISNTTVSRYIRVTFKTFKKMTGYGPNTCLCAVLSGTWTLAANPGWSIHGSGLLWGVQPTLDRIRLWGVLRSAWCLWPFVSFKQFQSSFSSVAGCIGPPNQLAVPPWAWSSCRSLIEVFLPTEGSSSSVIKQLLTGNGRIVFCFFLVYYCRVFIK